MAQITKTKRLILPLFLPPVIFTHSTILGLICRGFQLAASAPISNTTGMNLVICSQQWKKKEDPLQHLFPETVVSISLDNPRYTLSIDFTGTIASVRSILPQKTAPLTEEFFVFSILVRLYKCEVLLIRLSDHIHCDVTRDAHHLISHIVCVWVGRG